MLKKQIKEFRKEPLHVGILAKTLKDWEKPRKLTQEDLAKLIRIKTGKKCTDKYISAIENRKSLILPVERFVEISKIIGIADDRILEYVKEYLKIAR